MSILGYNGLNRCVKEFGLTQPAAILDKLCELVDEAFAKSETDIKDGMDIALCSLDFQPHPAPPGRDFKEEGLSNAPSPLSFGEGQGVRLSYSGAGNSLYHIRENNLKEYSPDLSAETSFVLKEVKADKQPIGKFAYRKPFTNHTIQLQKGDSVYIFTDGYADQFGGPK